MSEELRDIIRWNACYRAEWDATPNRYADDGVVEWGRSRRLGMLEFGRYKAYVGVQHIDPTKPGWGIVDVASGALLCVDVCWREVCGASHLCYDGRGAGRVGRVPETLGLESPGG